MQSQNEVKIFQNKKSRKTQLQSIFKEKKINISIFQKKH